MSNDGPVVIFGIIGALLMALSVWIYPSGFLDIPFVKMTFGTFFTFLGAAIIFLVGGFFAIWSLRLWIE